MAVILGDAGVLMRYAIRTDPLHGQVMSVCERLLNEGHVLSYAPQGIRESRNVLTRPIDSRGYRRTSEEADTLLVLVAEAFEFLPENAEIFRRWQTLVAKYAITGKSVHVANVVATALTHGATHILTLNERDFRRYSEVELIVP